MDVLFREKLLSKPFLSSLRQNMFHQIHLQSNPRILLFFLILASRNYQYEILSKDTFFSCYLPTTISHPDTPHRTVLAQFLMESTLFPTPTQHHLRYQPFCLILKTQLFHQLYLTTASSLHGTFYASFSTILLIPYHHSHFLNASTPIATSLFIFFIFNHSSCISS